MVALARKTLFREWSRFVPAILAIGFAGVLLVMQAALVLGIFGSAAIYVNASSADIWAGYPGTQSVSLGRPINRDLEMLLRMDSEVSQVEPVFWVDGDWRAALGQGGVSIYLTGINAQPNGMMFDHILPPDLRQRLLEPNAVIVDRADIDTLGVVVGDDAWIDGKKVHVVATISGLRALGGVNVIASEQTAQMLNSSGTTYLIARIFHPDQIASVIQRLSHHTTFGPYELWSAEDFAWRSQRYWMLDTGAGAAVLFLAAIVFLVGAVIASQALTAVVVSSAREYATLNALGAGINALRRVVLAQAAWIGGFGMIVGGVISTALLVTAQQFDVPIGMTPLVALVCIGLVLGLALVSGLIAMSGLLRADPAILMR
ncbi:ABC transporter permease [Aquirhabdus sp.]|uniref:ABC transporter permease n=1 Tax=Aquirhabdus sp. TaxID=2824160 RepID=UPI00396C3637